jgi:hypothetical protein
MGGYGFWGKSKGTKTLPLITLITRIFTDKTLRLLKNIEIVGRGYRSCVSRLSQFIDQHSIYTVRGSEQLVVNHKLFRLCRIGDFGERGGGGVEG